MLRRGKCRCAMQRKDRPWKWSLSPPVVDAELQYPDSAFEATLQQQGLVNRNDPAVLRIAERILALAQDGERDPIRLREGAVKSLR
jgi:hypothetical protein